LHVSSEAFAGRMLAEGDVPGFARSRGRPREIMNHRVLGAVFGIFCLACTGCGGEQPAEPTPEEEPADYRASLRSTLQALSEESGDPLLGLHFRSVI